MIELQAKTGIEIKPSLSGRAAADGRF